MLIISYIGRTLRTSLITFGFAFAFVFRRLLGQSAGPKLLRWYFQTCGAGFVKIGQFMALRYDLLPSEYCEELTKLLDHLPPESPSIIKKTIAEDLGQPVEVIFSEFDANPIGSASIAQAHGAILHNGEKVIVKVKRPGIERKFQVDSLNMRFLSRIIEKYGFFSNIDIIGITDEFIRLIREELDFRREARDANLLHELMLKDDIDHYSPKVYFELSGKSIITLERLEGIWLHELITAVHNQDQKRLLLLAQKDIRPQRVARLIFRSILVQMFRHRVFHADPHAANLVLLNGGSLGYVDFGMIGWLDEHLWAQQFAIRKSIAERKIHGAYEALLDTLEPVTIRKISRFEAEIKEIIRHYINTSLSEHATIIEKSSGWFFLKLFDTIRRAGQSMPLNTIRMYRAIIIADIVLLKVFPQIDCVAELKAFVQEESEYQLKNWCLESTHEWIQDSMMLTLMEGPQAVRKLASWVQNRLPQMGRGYIQHFTRIERAFTLGLQYFRTGAFLLGLIIISGRVFAQRLFPGSIWVDFIEILGKWWWIVAASALVSFFIIGRIVRRIEYPD